MVDYDKVASKNKESQPAKCVGCPHGAFNGTIPCMPKSRICCICDIYGKEECVG